MNRANRLLPLRSLAAATAIAFAAPALAGHVNASALQDSGHYDRFIIRFNVDTPERDSAAARQQLLTAVGKGSGVGIGQLRRLAVGADVIQTDRKLGSKAAEQLMRRLASNPHVEYVELDAMRRPTLTPNDTNYGSQWHYFEATAGINLPAAWDKATGAGTVVAVIDTGTTPHSDLSANYVTGYDFISDAATARDGNGRDSNPNDEGDWNAADECTAGDPAADSSWHGTHVAGTIAALTNNAKGVAGVAFNAKVMPLRVLGKCGGFNSDIADAIVWAAGGAVSGVPANSNPAEVINMSLGGPGTCDSTTQAAINSAVAAGTVVVVAAGNDNDDAANFSPASCNNIITVAAVGRGGARASYSNFGSKIDVSAPGGDGPNAVLSTINNGTTTQGSEGYAGYEGTSMATPHVAGTVALMQSAKVNSTTAVESILKATARPLPGSCPQGCGAGIIDAAAAIEAAKHPSLLIDDASITEGNSGTKTLTFTVRLTQAVATAVTYNIATSNGSATAGSDYVANSLVGQSIPAGQTSKAFNVTISGDTTAEFDENFLVNVSNVTGAAVLDAQARGAILNDETLPLTNGVPITGISGATGRHQLFSLAVPAGATGLHFTTGNGGGDADLYVRFGSAPTTSVFDCSSTGTTTAETCSISPAQTGTYFVLINAFSDITGVSLTGSYTPQSSPALSISDVSVTEGNTGTKLATFTVQLSAASSSPVTYDIATTGAGTATAGSDYVANSLTSQTIPAGQTSKTFSVTINGDTTVEANETYVVSVSNVIAATIGDGSALGTISNDDTAGLTIGDVAVAEGNSGSKFAAFTVSLDKPSNAAVTYNITTNTNGTATSGVDYVASSLTGQTIPAGQTSKTFNVTINGDTTVEANETYTVGVSNVVGATVLDGTALGTITNDDTASLSIGDVAVTEGNSGTKLATFTVSLNKPSNAAVTYNITTNTNGTATSGVDYVANSLTGQTIPAGQTSKTFSVTINGDTTVEANETYTVGVSNVVGATVTDGTALGTITNDDTASLSIGDVAVTEGNSGTKLATFTVTLNKPSVNAVTYNITTNTNGTATSGVDYVANSLTGQTIPAGQTSKTFNVTINGDMTVEANETYTVGVSNVVGATMTDGSALGTITNDD